MNLQRLLRIFFTVGIFLLVIFASSVIGFITDLWWFQEVGYQDVFLKTLTTKIGLFLAGFLLVVMFFLGNVLVSVRTKIPWIIFIPPSLVGQPITLVQKVVFRISVGVSLLLGILGGLVVASQWERLLRFSHVTATGTTDPIFHQDISFYFFTLPLLQFGVTILQILLFITLLWCGLIYLGRGSFQLKHLLFTSLKKKFTKEVSTENKPTHRIAYRHLGILLFLCLCTFAANIYLSLFSLLTQQGNVILGAGFTDVTIGIPLTYLSLGSAVLTALAALVWGVTGKVKPLFATVILSFMIGIVSAVVPLVFQNFIVAPNELAKETPYIKHNIEATKQAFSLDQVVERKISADKQLTAEDIANNQPTINNVRLWDREPLLSTFSQIQEIRTYYEFVSVDNDRYVLDGALRQVMLSPRELAIDTIPSRNWINETLTFTHGYGLTAGPVNQVTREGLPVLFVKDIPPESSQQALRVTQPEIYYGELANEYVVVKTKAKEFNYPKGEENVYATYTGTGGVQIDSWWKKLIYALHFGSLNLFLSNDVTTDSRIMYHRQVVDRVQKIAPFLQLDSDPYMVVVDGKLSWILDGYTMSSRYPYAQTVEFAGQPANYVRNAVKVVVNAYDGKVTFYLADTKDPLIASYAGAFPTLFKPLSEMPENMRTHLRYPEAVFQAQTAIYTLYHMDDPQMFYNREDQWEIPSIGNDTNETDQTKFAPRHMIMKLPGEEKEEFLLMLPFTPRAKDNMAAWMVARNDGEQYGKLVVYQFPKQKLIFGPRQIIGRINQDPEISRQISLWDQRGSQVIQGPLLVIPIEESLIYVRPLYLKSETGKIPELKRIIVAYENRIAMEETLEGALGRIFGKEEGETEQTPAIGEAQLTPTPPQSAPASTIQEANDAYTKALEAQKAGDWSRYGEEINRLGEILQRLEK